MEQNAKQKRNRTSNAQNKSAQKEHLIDYMNAHSEFAAGRHCGQMGQKNLERQWERLSDALNGLGNVKTVAQWQKVWIDLKSRARNKTKGAAKNMVRTGNPPMEKSLILTPQDTKILSTIGAQSCLGHENIPDSMESPQVVFEGNTLIVLEPPQRDEDEGVVDDPAEEGTGIEDALLRQDMDIDFGNTVQDNDMFTGQDESQQSVWSIRRRRLSEMSSSPPSPRQEPVAVSETAACPTTTSTPTSMATTSTATGGTSTTPGSKATGTSEKSPFVRKKSKTATPNARQHFSRSLQQRERRAELAIEMKDQFAQIQENQVKNQELMAKALMKLAETDAARLQLDAARVEQDKVTSAALIALAQAVTSLTRAVESRRDDGESY